MHTERTNRMGASSAADRLLIRHRLALRASAALAMASCVTLQEAGVIERLEEVVTAVEDRHYPTEPLVDGAAVGRIAQDVVVHAVKYERHAHLLHRLSLFLFFLLVVFRKVS